MKLNQQSKEAIRHIVSECNPLKSRLIGLMKELESINGVSARSEQLGKIIGSLESWQHKSMSGV